MLMIIYTWINFFFVAVNIVCNPHAIVLPTNDLIDYNATEFIALDTFIDDALFFNFGESSHGLVAMHQAATHMFRYLVEKKGFRIFVFESAWGIHEATQTFLKSNRMTLNIEEQFFLNAFSSRYTLQLLLWIREFNYLNAHDPIQIGGHQPEQPVTDLNALWKAMSVLDKFNATYFKAHFDACKAKSIEFKVDLDFVIHINQLRKKGQPSFTEKELAICNLALDQMKTFLSENQKELIDLTSLDTYQVAYTHLLSFHSYLNILLVHVDAVFLNKNMTQAEIFQLGHTIYQEGDRVRMDIFDILYEIRYKGRKIMLWMHNWHAMKNSPETYYSDNIPKGTISMGTRLARKYSDYEYVVLGSVVACPHCKNPLRNDSLETSFTTVLENRSSIIDLRNDPVYLRDRGLPIHSLGSLLVQNDETHLMDVILSKQFDGIYYIHQSKMLSEEISHF